MKTRISVDAAVGSSWAGESLHLDCDVSLGSSLVRNSVPLEHAMILVCCSLQRCEEKPVPRIERRA